MAKNIILVGFMGTGKSASGRLVAKRLDRQFVDMDTVIEERAGKKISDIFADEGEAHFRSLERNLARELSAREDLVIATGGGIVLNPDNISDFSRTGVVICLHADPDTILQRVAKDTHRPLLQGDDDKIKAIRELLAKRQKLYNAIPLRIDTNNHTARDTAEEVIALYLGQTAF
jgi:shikimate kinase